MLTEEDVRAYWDDEEFEKHIHEPGYFFPKYARWIKGDWNCLFGFRGKPDDAIVRIIYRGDPGNEASDLENCLDTNLVLNHVDVLCWNVDGAFWGFYTNDDDLFEKCLASVRKQVGEKYIEITDYKTRQEFYVKHSQGHD